MYLWKKDNDYQMEINCEVEANTLMEAADIVMNSHDDRFLFRRNREMMFNIDGNFRRFLFGGDYFILKIVSNEQAKNEIRNAVAMKDCIYQKNFKYNHIFEIAIPEIVENNKNSALILSDYGFTLYENPENTRSKISLEQILDYFMEFLNIGVEWAGFLPRNIILTNNKLTLIDWESVVFHSDFSKVKISEMTKFKFILGWSQIYGDPKLLEAKLNKVLKPYKTLSPQLDCFEMAYDNITGNQKGKKEIRYECNRATLFSEEYLNTVVTCELSPMDLGHIIDELLPVNLSVFYTFGTAKLRKKLGDLIYQKFVNALKNILHLGFIENTVSQRIKFNLNNVCKTIILALIMFFRHKNEITIDILSACNSLQEFYDIIYKFDSVCQAFIEFDNMRLERGFKNAQKRSWYIDIILTGIFNLVKDIFSIQDSFELLLRGSCAHCLMTSISDVDFEISSNEFPDGFKGVEDLIGTFLDIFNIRWEGSSGRPKEVDLRNDKGISRDLHEWSELRKPGSHKHNPGWLLHEFENDIAWWNKQSVYERTPHQVTIKFLFYEIRALISRIANKNNINYSCINCQLILLEDILPSYQINKLKELLYIITDLYENNNGSTKDVFCLSEQLSRIWSDFNFIEPIKKYEIKR